MSTAKSESTNNDLAIHTIVELIWKKGPISRAELSRESGFSRSTITLNVDRLLSLGILKEEPRIQNGGIGKRKSLTIARDQGVVIGVEMGASSCDIGICDITAEILEIRSFPVDFSVGPELILEKMMHMIDELMLTRDRILGIGVGLPSPVDFDGGYAVYPAFMPGWHLFPIKELLQKRYDCPVFVDNEANTMGLGESCLSEEFRDKNILFVKAGTAIGAGIIIHGDIYRGNSGLGGNIGHIQIEGSTEQCRCGKLGCLEAVAGGEAIARKAIEAAMNNKKTLLTEMYRKNKSLTAVDVKQAAAEGDQEALRIIKDAAQTLGNTIGKLVIFFDPKAVIIGGGLTGFGPQYIAYIRESIIHQCTPWVKSDFVVKESHYGSSIGIIGSAMLCIKELIVHGYLMG